MKTLIIAIVVMTTMITVAHGQECVRGQVAKVGCNSVGRVIQARKHTRLQRRAARVASRARRATPACMASSTTCVAPARGCLQTTQINSPACGNAARARPRRLARIFRRGRLCSSN